MASLIDVHGYDDGHDGDKQDDNVDDDDDGHHVLVQENIDGV